MKKSITLIATAFLLLVNCLLPTTTTAQYTQLTDFTGSGAFTGESPLYDQNLVSDGTFLYGMTANGGTSNRGTLFKILPNGTGFTKLLDFAGATNGSNPLGSLIYDGTFLYGMTYQGGTNSLGTLFKILPNGTGFTKLLDFAGATNGSYPHGSLISDGTFLYGMTTSGGTNNMGTLFKILPDGTGFTKLLDFAGATNGSNSQGSLIYDGTFLYGMTANGGTSNRGTLFKILPNGTGFTKLLDFAGATNGSYPYGSLISDGTFLYGMTFIGGTNNMGTLFKILPNGTGFTKLLDFAGATNGSNPRGSLISDGTFLYGMTYNGGTNNLGTLFKILPNGTGFTKLLDFAGATNGSNPFSSLISDGTFLYGMTRQGGTNGLGTLFKILPNGTGFTKLLDFAGATNGSNPRGSLISDGTFLYGMTSQGGTNGLGTLFKILPNGTGFTKLLDFAGATNGSNPQGSLISDGTFLYGMTANGGTNNMGTLFKILPNGAGFTKLLDFAGATNGSSPQGSLISDGTFLYGMTSQGGTNGLGTLFKILPNGTGFTKLLDFAGATNGSNPRGSLISDGTFLYGMTYNGGTNGLGTLFKILPNGTGFTKLLDFAGATNGSNPFSSLISDGTFLYGMTRQGGTNGLGTLFKILPNGTGFTKLLDFAGATNGSSPQGSLISDGTFLYGMTYNGGTNNLGTLFKILPNGTGFTKLLDFAGATNGSNPFSSLIADGTFLYGMTGHGGSPSAGTVFKYQYCMPTTSTQTFIECVGFSVTVGTNTYNSTGTYTDVLTGSNGCDSTITTNLTIKLATTGTDVQTACDSYLWMDSNTYTASNNTATWTLTNAANCDSVVTLNLTINNSNTGTDVQTACDSYLWMDGNTYTASNNTATWTLTNAANCDSVVTLNLTINNSNTGTDVQTACDSYLWIDGNTYTASNNTATWTLTNAANCDSVVTLNLTIKNSTTGTDVQTACDSYLWMDGNTYTASNNTATWTLTNAANCDSVVTLNLTINNSNTGTDVQTACDSYLWMDGNTYTASNNTATWTLTNAANCDSVVTLNLTINNSNTGTDVQTACDSYLWMDGNTYTASNNTATWTLTNAANCDSVVTLNLTINNSNTGTDVQTACDSYLWMDGNTYTASNNTATWTLTNAANCDSVVTLNLTIKNSTTGTDVQTACDSYVWPLDGNTYSNTTNTPTFNIVGGNANGCDSLVTLDLTIYPLPTVVIAAFNPDTVCATAPVIVLPVGTPSTGVYTGTGVTGTNFDPSVAGIGSHYVKYTFTDGNGCTSSDSTLIIVESCVGINEVSSLNGINIFPNPAKDVLNVTLSHVTTAVNFILTSIEGKVIYQLNNVTEQKTTIDISNNSKGIYFLRVGNDTSYNVYKVIKQ